MSTPGRANRVIHFTESALLDLAGIDNFTAGMWGDAQAERYQDFLRHVLTQLRDDPALASELVGKPGVLTYTAKYSGRRMSHGHRIVFRVVGDGIEVIRLLHTAMYVPDHLPEKH